MEEGVGMCLVHEAWCQELSLGSWIITFGRLFVSVYLYHVCLCTFDYYMSQTAKTRCKFPKWCVKLNNVNIDKSTYD